MLARATMCNDLLGSRGWGRAVIPRHNHWPFFKLLPLPIRYKTASYPALSSSHSLLRIACRIPSRAVDESMVARMYPSSWRKSWSTDHIQWQQKAQSTPMPLSTHRIYSAGLTLWTN